MRSIVEFKITGYLVMDPSHNIYEHASSILSTSLSDLTKLDEVESVNIEVITYESRSAQADQILRSIHRQAESK